MKRTLSLLLTFVLFTTLSALSAEMKFAQVSDAMFSAGDEHSVRNLQNVIHDINKQRDLSFVIFTGNNISKPNKNNLEEFLNNTKKLNVPYYVLIGNKDVNKQKDLSKSEYMKIVQKEVRAHKKIDSPNYVFEKNGVVFIVADGAKEVIPSPIGYYKADVLAWLDEQLNKYSNKNVVIIQHFPLIPPCKKENKYTNKAQDYLHLLAKHKNVKAVIAGHYNTNSEQKVNGILHISTENVPTYKIIEILDYNTQNPTFWSFCRQLGEN